MNLTEEEFYEARRILREKAYAKDVISSFLPKGEKLENIQHWEVPLENTTKGLA